MLRDSFWVKDYGIVFIITKRCQTMIVGMRNHDLGPPTFL
jgi:hypothetical protein